MSIADDLISSLEEFADRLERGERIIVKTVERCECNTRRLQIAGTKCHVCGGRGWIIDAKTMFAQEDGDE